MRFKAWAIFAALLPGVAGCKSMGEMLEKTIEKPTAEFQSMKLRSIDFEKVDLDFTFLVKNPNAVGINLSSFSYDLQFEEKHLAKGDTQEPIELKANGSAPVKLPLTVTFSDFADNIALLFSSKEEVPYTIDMNFGFDTFAGKMEVPLSQKGQVPLPKLPEVSVADVKLSDVGFTGASLEVGLDVLNKSQFPLKPKGLDYDLAVAGVSVSKAQQSLPDVAAGAKQRVVLPVKLNFLKLGSAAVNAVKSKKIPWAVKGNVDLGLFKQPFDLSGVSEL